jgi:hypothetical protein
MNSPITWLPTLMLLGLGAGFATHPPAPLTSGTTAVTETEIRELQQQRTVITTRLDMLEPQAHPFLPRGGISGRGLMNSPPENSTTLPRN